MADEPDSDQKTEAPSERKIAEALRKGNTPSSREVGTLVSMLAILAALSFLATGSTIRLAGMLARLIENPGGWRLDDTGDAVTLVDALLTNAFGAIWPIIFLLLVSGVAAAFVQGKPRLVLERIKPTGSRISLMRGLKRLFGLQGLIQFAIASTKFVMLAAVGVIIVKALRWDIFNAMLAQPAMVPAIAHSIVIALLSAMSVCAVFLAGADFSWSRFHWARELRMTREEVKNEHKQAEGDPIVKARLRSIARDRSRKRMMSRIPEATLVIANPTHYAIALRYKPDIDAAPLVLAKGTELIALKIREVATEHGIPVIEDRTLARPLHDAVEIDQRIPPEFYKAVAQIVMYLKAKRTGSRPH